MKIRPAVSKLFYAYRRMDGASEVNKRSAEIRTRLIKANTKYWSEREGQVYFHFATLKEDF